MRLKPLSAFLHNETAGGWAMLAFTVLALMAANTSLSEAYQAFVYTPITLGYAPHAATESLKDWIKDIGMVFFFLVIGLELKREMCEGFLSRRGEVILPLLAAVGGMLAPALIYAATTYENPQALHGWAIPSATDIAFALGVLTVFGKGLPPSLRVFLLAVAVFDDLGAIILIAGFYNHGIVLLPLATALVLLALLLGLTRLRIRALTPYLLLGAGLWFCFYNGGIHTTLAGVLVGLAIPMRGGEHAPAKRLLHRLHPWVSFGVLPLFAFTSAGVDMRALALSALLSPVPLGVALGLFAGKQIGIMASVYVLLRLRLAALPKDASWAHIYAVSVLAGIGFTMSFFIGMLAFADRDLQQLAVLGVLAGSLLSALWGILWLYLLPIVTKR